MDQWFLRNPSELQNFTAHVEKLWSMGHRPHVEISKGDRTSDQNNLFHKILREVAEQKGDESLSDLKRYAKLHFGVPELRASDPVFCEHYDRVIKPNLTYEQKLEAMDLLDVTSRLNVDQMSRVLDSMMVHFTQQGYKIKH